jgi:hypothetical protein
VGGFHLGHVKVKLFYLMGALISTSGSIRRGQFLTETRYSVLLPS